MTFWVAGAVVVGSVVSGVAANSAAGKQEDAANNANTTQYNMYNQNVAREQPFVDAGTGASSRLSELLGIGGNKNASGYGSFAKSFTGQDYLNNQDPGYQFQLQQGSQALRNADTPGVGALSGPALKDLINFNQGMASTGYQSAFDRYMSQQNAVFGRLSDIANRGQNAASQVGQQGTTTGQGIAQNTIGAGNAAAAGTIGLGNAISGGASTLGGLYLYNQGKSSAGGPSGDLLGDTGSFGSGLAGGS